jgi:hypothetical protein
MAAVTACFPETPRAAGRSRRDADVERVHQRRLWKGGSRFLLEVDLHDLSEVGERLLDRLALAGGLDLETAGDVPIAVPGDGQSPASPTYSRRLGCSS